jgi:hypothetical protein
MEGSCWRFQTEHPRGYSNQFPEVRDVSTEEKTISRGDKRDAEASGKVMNIAAENAIGVALDSSSAIGDIILIRISH